MFTQASQEVVPFDPNDTDKTKIGNGIWVPCRICRDIFARIRLTVRYCATCERAFCEGEHGSFVGGGVGVCVRCLKRRSAGELA